MKFKVLNGLTIGRETIFPNYKDNEVRPGEFVKVVCDPPVFIELPPPPPEMPGEWTEDQLKRWEQTITEWESLGFIEKVAEKKAAPKAKAGGKTDEKK